jgi:PAS domain S-box-containing protein
LITINQVNCKDCYKCVRYCPVKAIRVVGGHAEVVDERCLGDGSCLRVCPQHAKHVRGDVEVVRGLLASGRPVMASIAPAAPGVFGDDYPRLLGAVKALGFARVEETARTAEAGARPPAALAVGDAGTPVITSACPAVVSLVEKYYPQYVPRLAPIPSPMVAHARLLREEYGADTAVVFIGPCIAKKEEGTQEGVNAALTFDELREWLEEEHITLATATPAVCDNAPVGLAEIFPILSGLLITAGVADDAVRPHIVTVAGLQELREMLDSLSDNSGIRLIEALACKGGCLLGPGAADGPEFWARRQALLLHMQAGGTGACPSALCREFTTPPLCLPMPTEEEITAVLHSTGKHTPADEQNCGACGYDTCREKAVAVLQGMAEAEMCIPYMRSRAESFANVVINSTPNATVVVDDALRILSVNPAFESIFARPQAELLGRPIASVLDGSGYERVQRTGRPYGRHQVTYGKKIVREMIFPGRKEDFIIGIYVDVTDEEAHQQQLQTVKRETLRQARQVIDKQMRVAQEIAGLLGETTAETKVLLTRLIHLSDEEDKK